MKTGRRDRAQAAGWLLCFLSLGVLLVPSTPVLAQETTGTITGELVDTQNAVLPGVTVTITNSQSGRVTTVMTDGAGKYRASVDPGHYRVAFELSGFARQEMPD